MPIIVDMIMMMVRFLGCPLGVSVELGWGLSLTTYKQSHQGQGDQCDDIDDDHDDIDDDRG